MYGNSPANAEPGPRGADIPAGQGRAGQDMTWHGRVRFVAVYLLYIGIHPGSRARKVLRRGLRRASFLFWIAVLLLQHHHR